MGYESIVKLQGGGDINTLIGIRFPDAIVKKIDALVESNEYSSRPDVVRDLVREGFENRVKKEVSA